MTGNRLIKLIHDFPALDEKWRELSPEKRKELVDSVLSIAEGVIGVAEIWATMQIVAPDAERTAVCGQCYKRRKLTGERIHASRGVIKICGKCKKKN